MKRFLPTTQRRWAIIGMMLVSVLVVLGKGPLWLITATLLYILSALALRWSSPMPIKQENAVKPNQILKNP